MSGTTRRGHPLEMTTRTVAGRRTRFPAPGLSSTTVPLRTYHEGVQR